MYSIKWEYQEMYSIKWEYQEMYCIKLECQEKILTITHLCVKYMLLTRQFLHNCSKPINDIDKASVISYKYLENICLISVC